MNKAELIDAVATRLGHSKRDVTDIVEAFIDETKKAVVRGEKVAVSGFGVFESQARKARLGRNPRTGETVKIKATKLPKLSLIHILTASRRAAVLSTTPTPLLLSTS